MAHNSQGNTCYIQNFESPPSVTEINIYTQDVYKSCIHSSELFLVVLDQFKGRVTTRLTLLKTWSSLKANCKLVDGVLEFYVFINLL